MKVSGKVLNTTIDQGAMIAQIQLNGKLPHKGEHVVVKWGSNRNLQQNSLYWVFLNWVLNDANLKDQGHFSVEALHLNLKTFILAEKIFDKGRFKAIEEASTATLSKSDFGEYLTRVDEVVQEIFKIDTSSFWQTYAQDYQMRK